MIKNSFILIFILVSSSCQKQLKTIDECDELAMHAYRGWPKALSELQKECKEIPYTYTGDRCQKAFRQMVLGKNESEMQKLFGAKIMKCFNQVDIERFLANPAPAQAQTETQKN